MTMRTRVIILAVLLLMPMILTQNCSKPKSNGNAAQTGSLQDAAQPPSVSCAIQSSSGTNLVYFGNSAAASRSLQPIVTGTSVKLNCNQSAGDTALASDLI